jgi:hypothetical protein
MWLVQCEKQPEEAVFYSRYYDLRLEIFPYIVKYIITPPSCNQPWKRMHRLVGYVSDEEN